MKRKVQLPWGFLWKLDPKNNRKRTRGRKYKFVATPFGRTRKVWLEK